MGQQERLNQGILLHTKIIVLATAYAKQGPAKLHLILMKISAKFGRSDLYTYSD